ncbi:glycoside hydrolase family 5 protein [Butyrivibrio sp. WCE2006]|uniref:glycoside hydrolase family 5 protein n=1 Tax=Butyrivibrio sp. WCE2006 TaxID=1410611 RepID=UPI0005D1B5BB|nr:glycoside hydrolase family 5 protein [Butyrivibrio sp. WCE2006]
MKNNFSRMLFAALLITICSINTISSSASAEVSLSATNFIEEMNTGWNLGNSLDSHYGDPTGDGNLSQETIWGNPEVTKAQIDYVKSLGFNVIRVPVTWHTHTYRDKTGSLHIHPDWLRRVKEVVDYCISDNFYVIINIHHDGSLIHAGVNEKEFSKIKADATSLWTEISSTFSSYDSHLLFEAYNEIDNYEKYWSFGKRAANQMNELNQLFVDVVRKSGKNNSNRILVVPPLLHSSGEKFQNAFVLPKDTSTDKLIVSVHDYSSAFDQSLEPFFESVQSFSKKIGAPVIIDEWGTTDTYTPAQYRAIHASNYIARATDHGIKCIYWDNGSNFAIVDRNSLTCNESMISSIMSPKPYTSKDTNLLSDWKQFQYMSINQQTGDLIEDKNWGSIILNVDGNGSYPIPKNKESIYVGLSIRNKMSDHRIHYVYFFDSNNKMIDKINDWNGFIEKNIPIPQGSTYVRIGINSAYSATSQNEYKQAIENGDLSVIVNFY